MCAEGVEDLEDLAVLARMDVAYAQGWVLGPPAGPWPAVAPEVAAATSAERALGHARAARRGRRRAADPRRGWPPSSPTSPHTDDMARVAHLIAPVMGADEATVSRLLAPGGPRSGT